MPQLGIKCRFTIICLLVAILSAALLSFPVVALGEIEQYNVDLNAQYIDDPNEGDQDAIHQDMDDLGEVVMPGLGAPAQPDDNLFGDILIGEDSGYNALYPVKAGDKFTFTFRLFFNGIKKSIESIRLRDKLLKPEELNLSLIHI